ncbi:MAG: hypothetical protein QXG98_06195 [Candidatus Micrarchaeia archaeon]
MEWLVLRKKPTALLINLKNSAQGWYVSSLARAAGVTYVYAARTLSAWEKFGLVTFEAKGRVKMVRLTEKGARLAAALDELVRMVSELREAVPEKPKEAAGTEKNGK